MTYTKPAIIGYAAYVAEHRGIKLRDGWKDRLMGAIRYVLDRPHIAYSLGSAIEGALPRIAKA